jgi:hypothetical protein
MPSFTDYLDSDYLEAANRLQPKSAPNQVTVYVESYEDIAFWSNILKPYQSPDIKFKICLPSNTHIERGKVSVLKRSNDMLTLFSEEQLGRFLLICVDSDYDYLLHQQYKSADKQATATKINVNPFILQTYTYSIENYRCYSDSLEEVCTTATLSDTATIDFVELLKQYSNSIYDLLLWNLFFYAKGRENEFPLSDFIKYIKMSQTPTMERLPKALRTIRNNVDTKNNDLETKFPNLIESVRIFEKVLNVKGLSKDNAYLFVQGHTLQDNFVLMTLNRVYEILRDKQIETIKNKGLTGTQISDEIRAYKNKITKISTILSTNTNFKDCFLFEKIEADIDSYLKSLSII